MIRKIQQHAKKSDEKNIDIDIDGLEARMVLLSLPAGNYGALASAKGKIIFLKYPDTGMPDDAKPTLNYYDIDKREEKKILDAVDAYWLSANGQKILVAKANSL